VREFLAAKQITVLEHPAYSPDLASIDFFLLLKIKEILKGRHFDDIDDIRSNTTVALKAIPQHQFQNCFEGWTRHWHQCKLPKGSTLKATTVVFSNEVCSTFTAMSLQTLLSDHVYDSQNKCHVHFLTHLPYLQSLDFLAHPSFQGILSLPSCQVSLPTPAIEVTKLDLFIRDITHNYFTRKPELFIFCMSGYEQVQ